MCKYGYKSRTWKSPEFSSSCYDIHWRHINSNNLPFYLLDLVRTFSLGSKSTFCKETNLNTCVDRYININCNATLKPDLAGWVGPGWFKVQGGIFFFSWQKVKSRWISCISCSLHHEKDNSQINLFCIFFFNIGFLQTVTASPNGTFYIIWQEPCNKNELRGLNQDRCLGTLFNSLSVEDCRVIALG